VYRKLQYRFDNLAQVLKRTDVEIQLTDEMRESYLYRAKIILKI